MDDLPIAEALVIRPGDHLIVRVERDVLISAAEAEDIRHHLLERLPALSGVTVIAADGLAVFRPESDA